MVPATPTAQISFGADPQMPYKVFAVLLVILFHVVPSVECMIFPAPPTRYRSFAAGPHMPLSSFAPAGVAIGADQPEPFQRMSVPPSPIPKALEADVPQMAHMKLLAPTVAA